MGVVHAANFRLDGAYLAVVVLLLSACGPASATPPASSALKVLAAETFLADIAQNVAGDRLKVEALMPSGIDPHSYEPTPGDVTKVAQSRVLIVNGAGFEGFLNKLLENAGGEHQVIEASAGLTSRVVRAGEVTEMSDADLGQGDPHFWLDPNYVVKYVENIRDGLSRADPAGAATYTKNADAYIAQLKELDRWITAQVKQVPPSHRLLVTNHESFGYFADRYSFKIIGTIVPSMSTGASPSAQQLARLVDRIKATGAPAIFLETGTNPQLAKQIAQETGVKVVTELYTHSTTEASGPAPTYIEMMRYNTRTIVDALK
jgi:ABC-type Zn uptake system ZnuABC Zn-binding protein ZnuA